MTAAVLGVDPDTWDVIGTMASTGALLIGAVAAIIAALEYRAGRAVRREQSRPYMTLAAEPSPAGNYLIDIVVKNIGTTPALDLRIEVDPPFVEVRPDEYSLSRARIFNEPIEMWPPGQEMRAFFDSYIERNGKDMPTAHVAILTYGDGRGDTWSERVVIDLDLQAGLTYVETFGIHHAAKALREIEKVLHRSRVLNKGELEVTAESRAERRQRENELREERLARRKGLEKVDAPRERDEAT